MKMDEIDNYLSARDKAIIITDANSVTGKSAAVALAKLHPRRLILACNDLAEGELIAEEILSQVPHLHEAVIAVRHLDISSLDSVRKFCKIINATERSLHILLNNAAVIGRPDRQTTVDDNEITFATNHLGHFLLTNLLLGLLKKSAPSRVLIISGDAHKFCWPYGYQIDDPNAEEPGHYTAWNQYCQSKLANILFAIGLHERLNGNNRNSGVSVFSLQPDDELCLLAAKRHKQTDVYDKYTPAATTVYCAVQPGIERQSGSYFKNRKVANLWQMAADRQMADKLWHISQRLCHII